MDKVWVLEWFSAEPYDTACGIEGVFLTKEDAENHVKSLGPQPAYACPSEYGIYFREPKEFEVNGKR